MSIDISYFDREARRRKVRGAEVREIQVDLTNTELKKLRKKCAKYGLAVGELIEIFIEKWINGTCDLDLLPKPTLLDFLFRNNYDIDEFMERVDNRTYAAEMIKDIKEDPDEDEEYKKVAIDHIEKEQKEVDEIMSKWKPKDNPNIEEEYALIIRWILESESL